MAECVGIVGVGLMGQAFSHYQTLCFKAEGGRRTLPPPRPLSHHPVTS
jgi:hypothetical protein